MTARFLRNFLAIATAMAGPLGSGAANAQQDNGQQQDDQNPKGYDITPTGPSLAYPAGYECSPLTSLYASWIDVDGSMRTRSIPASMEDD